MKITNLQATALKGQSFSLAVGPLTMITGGNDRGKTARADALRLALLGYLPEHGKTNGATFALSGGSRLKVEAQIEGHGLVSREWKQSGKTVKATSTGVETLPETPLVAMDAAEYFGKSDAARVQMLWELLHMEHSAKWTPEAVKARVVGAMGTMTPELKKGVESMFVAGAGDTVQVVMERATKWLAEEASKFNADVARWEKTAQGITQAGMSEEPVDPARVEADFSAAQARLETLVRDHARLGEIVRAQNDSATRERELAAKIAELRANLGNRALPTDTRETLEANLAKALENLTLARERANTYGQALANYRERQKRHTDLLASADMLPALEAVHASAVQATKLLEEELAAIPVFDHQRHALAVREAQQAKANVIARQQANDKAAAELQTRTDGLLKAKCCPSCGARGGDYEAMVREIFDRKNGELQGEASVIAEEFRITSEALDAAVATQEDGLKRQRVAQGLERRVGEAKSAEAEAFRALGQARKAAEQVATLPENPEPQQPEQNLEPLETAVAQARDDLRRLSWNEQLAAALQSLTDIQAAGGGDDDTEQRHATLADEIEAQRQRIEELGGQRKKAGNQLADKKRLAQAAEAKGIAESEGAAVAKGRKELAAARAEMIKETFAPLLDTANKFTRGILPTALEYREGEIGRFNGGSWVPVACMGGTHRAVAYAGLQAALGAGAPAKVVIMDEMGRFDVGNKVRFLENVAAAVKDGTIEQFVGIDVDPEPYRAVPGLTLVEVGK